MPPNIAIIGAGLSGLACARLLHQHGIAVQLFDKSRAAGGRISTRRGEGWQCDHGAQYFTARSEAFRAEVAQWRAAGIVDIWSPKLVTLDQHGMSRNEETIDRFVGVPRMSALPRHLALPHSLHTGITISEIRRNHGKWQLSSQESGPIDTPFDALILAIPAPQAWPLLKDVAPDLARIAAESPMQGCWALMLQYEAPLNLDFDAAFVNHGPLRWIARDRSKPLRTGQESWLLHANTAWSEQHIEADPQWVAQTLQQAFIDLGGTKAHSHSIHRWRYADTQTSQTDGFAFDPVQQIGLCGDWLNGGKVEGAWLSGKQLAERMLASLG